MKRILLLTGTLLALLLSACVPAADENASPSLPAHTPTFRPDGQLKIFHIRPDGGSTDQCNGETDQAYPGEGTGQDCAWDHPFRALPPGGPPRIQGGDTLIIHPGSYPMGLDAILGLNPDVCDPDYPWDCVMPPIPSGPDADHPTRILGVGWDAGCLEPPELWGRERASNILDLSGSQHVSLACLEITDHAACAEDHPDAAYRCERETPPYGDWADTGLYAQDAADITLSDIDIHGLGVHGMWAGRLTDWTVRNFKLRGNGWVGWDGDIEGGDHNSGTLSFDHWLVEWNGCVESFPPGEMLGCWAQPAGGYGDGVGTGETGGVWKISRSTFRYNTQDGLDLLYGDENIQIDISQTLFEGNAGNQLKTSGPLTLTNSILIGNCSFFEGKPFTASGNFDGEGGVESAVDPCRATGVTLSMVLQDGQHARLVNNTITGEGDCLIVPECHPESRCSEGQMVTLINNLFQGQPDYITPGERVCLFYSLDFQDDPLDSQALAIANVKDDDCPGSGALCLTDLGLASSALNTFDPRLLANSPLIDAGSLADCPDVDYWGTTRPQGEGCDIGAYEWMP